jgi:hypothetical protein
VRRVPSRARAVPLLAAGLLAGCFWGPSQHTVARYRDDPAAAAALARRAGDVCAAMDPPEGLPARAFVTDGCSSFPDGDWVECCVTHDIPYWCGGTSDARAEADEALRACVAERRSRFLARAMKLGVRLGGHPVWPAHFRWGFGRDWPSGYTD